MSEILADSARLSDLYGVTVQEAQRLLDMAEGDAAAVENALRIVFGGPGGCGCGDTRLVKAVRRLHETDGGRL